MSLERTDSMIARRWLAILAVALGAGLLVNAREGRARGDDKAPAADKKEQANWKKLFDGKSLTGWKAANFGGEGKVKVDKGAIVMELGEPMTGVAYTRPDFPKMNYEVTLEGKKLAGNDFFCTTTFPVGDSFCSLVIGGWGGSIVGISSINFQDASENETSTFQNFKQDQWYKIRIRVTPHRIESWIDQKQVVDLDTRDKKLSIRIECDLCKPFGIATYRTTGAVRDLQVRPLTAAEVKAARQRKD